MLAAMAVALMGAKAQTQLEYANAGDEACRAEKWQEAVDNYKKSLALDADKSDYTTAMQLGYCYEQLGDAANAAEAYKDSYLRGNYDGGILTNMRKAYETAGNIEGLKAAYKEIAVAFPEQSVSMAKRLVNIYMKEGDNANCLACVETILTDPELDDAGRVKYYKNAAGFALKLDSTDIAQSYYDKVLAVAPNDPEIHKAIGVGLYNQIKKNKKKFTDIYEAKKRAGSKHPLQDYADMNKGIKPVTMKFAPIAIEHLKVANSQQADPENTRMIADLQKDMSVYNKK